MATEKEVALAEELSNLGKKYRELTDSPFPETKEEARREQNTLKESGQLIADFYNNRFLIEYAGAKEPSIRTIGIELYNRAIAALTCIEKGSYFGLGVLLLPQGSIDGDPNDLERWVEELGKQ
jgi:hypothetical protein